MLTRIVILYSVLSLTISEEIRATHPAKRENLLISDDQIFPINSTKRGEPATINISDILRKYARVLSNSNSSGFLTSPSSSSGKKAYIQDDENQTPSTNNQSPTIGLFEPGPNGNLFGQVTNLDLFPYIINNVLSPLVQRVIVEGNLVSGISSLWRGVYEGGATQSPSVPTPPKAAPQAPQKQYVVDIAVAEEVATTPKAKPPRRRRTRGSTTTTTTTTEKSSTTTAKGDLTEGEVESTTTTSKSKYRLVHRTRTPASSTTSQKPLNFEDNQDDEDETLIFNKLSHL